MLSRFTRTQAFLCASFLVLLFLPHQAAHADFSVQSVRAEGNYHIDSDRIVESSKLTKGSYSREAVTRAVKNIYRTGFFAEAQAEYDSETQTLILRVKEKPVARKVFIKGNEEVSEKDLSEHLQLGQERFVDKVYLRKVIEKAQAFYQSKGYHDALLEYSLTQVENNEVDITYQVNEGPRYAIRSVRIHGLSELDEDKLLGEIQTRRYKWWNSWLLGTGRLNPEALKNDRLLLQQYLANNGYLEGKVAEGVVDKEEDGLVVSFEISEGEQYHIDSITASGDLIEGASEKTLEGIDSEVDEVFHADEVRQDSFVITEKFSDIGYAFTNVVPGTKLDRANKKVSLEFQIDKGNLISIDKINISGNRKTYDNVIRRELRISERDLYSSSKIKRSRRLLERLGYFEEVTITDEVNQDSDTVDLNVGVREGPTGSFSAGAGYSSTDGMLLNTRLTERNFLGSGRRLDLNLDFGTRQDNLSLSVTDPRFLDTYWSVGLDALKTRRRFPDFDRDLAGGGFTVGYPLEEFFSKWAEDVSFSVKYQYLDISINDVDPNNAAQFVIDSAGDTTASSITPRIFRNTINNPLNPTEGSRQSLSVELAGLGGEEEFWIFEAMQHLYYPLRKDTSFDLTFAWRTRFEYGDSFNGEPLPLFKRYFPGGINSVRGYKVRTLGPTDANGNEYGGSKELVNNLELIFPLVQSAGLQAVTFYDFGEAFDDEQSIDFGELRQAYGFGLRWASPLGPIRIEFGFPIDREEGEDGMVTLFSFGAPL